MSKRKPCPERDQRGVCTPDTESVPMRPCRTCDGPGTMPCGDAEPRVRNARPCCPYCRRVCALEALEFRYDARKQCTVQAGPVCLAIGDAFRAGAYVASAFAKEKVRIAADPEMPHVDAPVLDWSDFDGALQELVQDMTPPSSPLNPRKPPR